MWHGVSFWLFPDMFVASDLQVTSDAAGLLGLWRAEAATKTSKLLLRRSHRLGQVSDEIHLSARYGNPD